MNTLHQTQKIHVKDITHKNTHYSPLAPRMSLRGVVDVSVSTVNIRMPGWADELAMAAAPSMSWLTLKVMCDWPLQKKTSARCGGC